MSTDYHAAFDEAKTQFTDLRESMPKTMQIFGKLHHATMSAGALDVKTKELISLAIGISSRCEGCMMSHITGAYRNGATLADIEETIGVAISMGGGPSTVYGGKALAIAKQFEPKAE
ncbi:MAG: carboxymuconolactone decarboxylase family protein [Candidatus Hydrogenedentota bacterium]